MDGQRSLQHLTHHLKQFATAYLLVAAFFALMSAGTPVYAQAMGKAVVDPGVTTGGTPEFIPQIADTPKKSMPVAPVEQTPRAPIESAPLPPAAPAAAFTGVAVDVKSGNMLDVSIEGEGFFRVKVSAEKGGGFAYTRIGKFFINKDGDLILGGNDGYALDPGVRLDATITQLSIQRDGQVSELTAATPNTPHALGVIQLATFANPKNLMPVGGALYKQTDASGEARMATPGNEGAGILRQGVIQETKTSLESLSIVPVAAAPAVEEPPASAKPVTLPVIVPVAPIKTAEPVASATPKPANTIEQQPIRPATAALQEPSKPAAVAPASTSTFTSTLANFGQVAAALAIVIGLIFVAKALARKFIPGAKAASGKGVIEILARHPLTKNQSIVLVRIGSQIVALNQGKDASESVLIISDQSEVASIIGQIEGKKPGSASAGFNHLLANARIDLEQTGGDEPDLQSMNPENLDEQLEEMAAAKRQLMELRQHVRTVRDRLPRT